MFLGARRSLVLISAAQVNLHRVHSLLLSAPIPPVSSSFVRNFATVKPVCQRSSLVTNMAEFGDDSFLDDFDPDAFVREKRMSEQLQRQSNENNENACTKRPKSEQSALESTLQEYFGYPHYRPGQLPVLQAVLEGQDAAVFWATGSGKSLCYQIPALHLNKVALVVSPLISLMQDQVHKLNGLSDRPLAVFLGSAQNDPQAELKAWRGDYPLIYVTPEKVNSAGFQSQIQGIAQKLCLIAIDEAHCVSEWGNDFRKDYRSLGTTLRSAIPDIPILSLTATATDRVQQDIISSLRLRNPFIAKRSFDRTNLQIKVVKKKAGSGMVGHLHPVLQAVQEAKVPSTIVYAPTRNQVEEITAILQSNCPVPVQAYHAGLSPEERQRAHTGFLTGEVSVIVATVAFGMGIDKPDIRRIFHYAPPKTVEEFYQQIGRAGRDGLPAECILCFSESDFDRYKSDFYLGGLTPEARRATEASLQRLRSFAMDSEICRRRTLLEYFDQTPPFGAWCGTCDVCLNRQAYGDDTMRDFGPLGARLVLTAIGAIPDQGLTNIVKVLGGNTVESYRYARNVNPQGIQKRISDLKEEMAKRPTINYLRELIAPLVSKGFVSESTKKAKVQGYDRSWTVYRVSSKGMHAMGTHSPIMLPVPESVRASEKQEEERRQRVLADLAEKGLKKEKIPATELEQGDGDVIRAYSKWYTYLDSARRSGKEDRLNSLERLLSAVEKWRSETAVQQSMAPASVLAEHLLVSICYTVASLPPSVKPDKQSVVAAGVRNRAVDGLVAVLGAWVEESQSNSATESQQLQGDAMMVVGETAAKNTGKWQYAVHKPNKKTGKATWELSYDRFAKGESPQTIAMAPVGGKKPIQAKTVVGHLLEAVVHGRNVDLNALVPYIPPPTRREWEELAAAELSTGMDVCADPAISGKGGERFTLTDFLRPIVGDSVVDTPFAERTDETRELLTKWFSLLNWYLALRRSGYEPTFAG